MKLNPKVFNKAANLIETRQSQFACWAIKDCVNSEHKHYYLVFFKSYTKETDMDAWYSFNSLGYPDRGFSSSEHYGILSRAIALDLMAELVKDENRKNKSKKTKVLKK